MDDEIAKQYMEKLNKFTNNNKALDLELDALMNDDPELQIFMNNKNDSIDLDNHDKDSSNFSFNLS
jgi:hypothetical protein